MPSVELQGPQCQAILLFALDNAHALGRCNDKLSAIRQWDQLLHQP